MKELSKVAWCPIVVSRYQGKDPGYQTCDHQKLHGLPNTLFTTSVEQTSEPNTPLRDDPRPIPLHKQITSTTQDEHDSLYPIETIVIVYRPLLKAGEQIWISKVNKQFGLTAVFSNLTR